MDLTGIKLSDKEIEWHTQSEISRNSNAHAHETPYSFYRKVYKQKMHSEQNLMAWAGREEWEWRLKMKKYIEIKGTVLEQREIVKVCDSFHPLLRPFPEWPQ